jgi:hypothetical protein
MATEDEKAIERNGVLVVPAWIGPAKTFVFKRGAAYLFGMFLVSGENLVFSSEDNVIVNECRRDVEIEWPRHFAGSGFWIKTPSARYAICFGKPFPDAPGPKGNAIAKTAAKFEGISNLDLSAVQGWLFGAEALAQFVRAASAVSDLRKGRRTAARVRAVLEE